MGILSLFRGVADSYPSAMTRTAARKLARYMRSLGWRVRVRRHVAAPGLFRTINRLTHVSRWRGGQPLWFKTRAVPVSLGKHRAIFATMGR
jgi:hypothetical protein